MVILSVPSPNQLPGSEAYDASRVGYPDSRSITNEDPVSTTSNVNGPSGPKSRSNLRRRHAGDHAAADNLALGGFSEYVNAGALAFFATDQMQNVLEELVNTVDQRQVINYGQSTTECASSAGIHAGRDRETGM